MQIDYQVQDSVEDFQTVTVDVEAVLKQAMQENMRDAVCLIHRVLEDSAPMLRARARPDDMLSIGRLLGRAAE